MLTALLTVENLFGESYDTWNVNVEAEYHEEQVGKDRRKAAPRLRVGPLRSDAAGSPMIDRTAAQGTAERSPVSDECVRAIASLAAGAGLGRIGMVAWRDLDDPEAGGSELHAHEIARRWAAAGVEVVMRTSAVEGGPRVAAATGTTWFEAPAAIACSHRHPSSSPPAGSVRSDGSTPSSRFGTACRF